MIFFYNGALIGTSDASGALTLPAQTFDTDPATITIQDFAIPIAITVSNFDASVLPVELVDFQVENMESEVLIKWIKASEIDHAFFAVERSLDGRNFIEIDRVYGEGNASELKNYSTVDIHPATGRNYYRLSQTDVDGSVSLSEVKSVNFEGKTNYTLYPSIIHTGEALNVDMSTAESATTLSIFDLEGRLVHTEAIAAGSLVSTAGIEVQSGIYIAKIGGLHTQRIIVR